MNECKTYFAVFYNDGFDKKDFCETLLLDEVQLDTFHKEKLIIGFNEKYEVDINDMIRKTIKPLLGKEDELDMLRRKYNLKYYLALVPTIKVDGVHPILSLAPDIVEFLYLTGTEEDLDYYIVDW